MGLFLPFVSMHRITTRLGERNAHKRTLHSLTTTLTLFVFFVLWIALFASTASDNLGIYGIYAFGWFAYFTFACIIASQHLKMRERFAIRGNFAEDFFCALLMYPQALAQMVIELNVNEDGPYAHVE